MRRFFTEGIVRSIRITIYRGWVDSFDETVKNLLQQALSSLNLQGSQQKFSKRRLQSVDRSCSKNLNVAKNERRPTPCYGSSRRWQQVFVTQERLCRQNHGQKYWITSVLARPSNKYESDTFLLDIGTYCRITIPEAM